jgi:hypothetical protein
MAAVKPQPTDVLKALAIYVAKAYGQTIPLTVKSQIAILQTWGGQFFAAPVFVPDTQTPPRRYTLRLGNRNYPHMKLVIELSADGSRWLFRVDAHDRHVCPPQDAPEHADFRLLMENNQKLVEEIETEWANQGLPTFKTFLRDDLARRSAATGRG